MFPVGSVLGGLLASLTAAPARGEDCQPTTAEIDPALPAPWRAGLEELAARTGRQGAPWACHGGTMRLDGVAGSTRRRLVVTDARGRAKTQDLETADDVVPLGEAVLAQPLDGAEPEPAPASEAAAASEGAQPPDPTAPMPPRPAPPRTPEAAAAERNGEASARSPAGGFVLGATIGPRLAVPHEVLTGAVRVHALGGIGDVVVVGGFARVEGPSWALGDTAADTSTVGLGPTVGARLPLGALEARLALEPSAALVLDRTGARDAELDARVGLGADAVAPLGARLGLVVGVDAEISPFRLGDGRRRGGSTDADTDGTGRDAGEPPMPGAMLGLRLGLEVRP